jgi:hypothetical protein
MQVSRPDPSVFSAIEIIIGDIKHYELRLFAAIAAIAATGLLAWSVYLKRRERKKPVLP